MKSKGRHNLNVEVAKQAAMQCGAGQVVVMAFYEDGWFGVASYGRTKEQCGAAKPLCDKIADGLLDGSLPAPNGVVP